MEPIILQKIDESLLSEYSCLEISDRCYFIGEYAARQGFGYINSGQSIKNMNDIINNFKKPMDRRELPEWHYKEKAILQIADWMVSTTCWDKIKGATWVPIPPSKIKTDPLYDDRLWRVLQKMQEIENTLDARKLLMARYSRESAHNRDALRPKVQDHIRNFTLDESQRNPTPKAIILFDDVITSGANFKAAQIIIQKEFPDVPIIGLFIARNVWVENIA